MNILVTGSSGHLGEAILRTLKNRGHSAHGVDLKPSPITDFIGDIADPALIRKALAGKEAVIHTAALHKPHVGTHSKQQLLTPISLVHSTC
jgi:UDP-glucose 4-epimerase